MKQIPINRVIYLGPPEALASAREVLGPMLKVVAPEPTREAVGARLDDAIGIVDASMKVTFDRAILDRAPKLRVISTATTGADHIDSQVLTERKITLLTLAGEREVLQNLMPTPEVSWALLMACCRRLQGAFHHVLEGQWVREQFPGLMLKGKVLGLIGCGRIGSWMARYARAFNMKVIGYDPFVTPWPKQIHRTDVHTLLSTADFVTVHVPLNEQTRGLIGAGEFGLIKRGAIFINTARGAVADEQALLNSLLDGRLAAVGLDVLEGEPEIDRHPLVEYARTHDNLIITPHIGGFSPDAVKVAVAHASRHLLDHMRTEFVSSPPV